MQDPRLAEAAQRRLADDFRGAWALCQAVLQEQPGNAAAMSIMAICAIETGDVETGRKMLDQAEQADGAEPLVHLYRSVQLEAQGDLAGGVEAARRASELAPDRFDAWGRYGDLAGKQMDFKTCAFALGKALEAEPDHPAAPQVALRLAGACMEQLDLPGTHAALEVAERGGLAGTLDVLRLKSELARHAGDWNVLAQTAQAWLDQAPEDLEAMGALAMGLGQQGLYRRAVRVFQPVVDADGTAENWAAMGRLVLGTRDFQGAREAFDTALAIDPACAEACFGLSRILTFMGDTDEAARMCRRTLEIDPGNFEAYGQLSEVTGGRLTDAELEQLEIEVEKPGQPADRLSIGLFALGDAYHRRKRHEEAFRTWDRANETKKLQHNGAIVSAYDRAEQERRSGWLEQVFPGPVSISTRRELEQQPLFIVGMPRSGTTLIEAAIAAHDDVIAGGELSMMPSLFEDFMRWARETGWSGGDIPEDRLAHWRGRYLSQYRDYGLTGSKWVTDKQPANFIAVGLMRRIFPDSPVIHIRRKPVEVAFSIYRRNFSRMWPYAHDLDDIAHVYAQQARLGAHWAKADPDWVTPLQYEELVREFEPKLRHVVERCGLAWDEKCLRYYEADRAVMTFSAVQVRKPPSADHLDSTTPYAAHLEGFQQALAGYPVDPETGAWTGADAAEPSSGGVGTPKQSFLSRMMGRGSQ
ncbi:tetratricopeptide repeat-containing sulfotransferase family protein [Maricaulis parjimensis]|uniref:tetratricopeptide repeat-containing sulfotransferase family protein n=1 Tax=Maricaulis parjimensis TaxID=144023 RepID=UPI0019397A0C|nr:tetratricopeptide repeat-containing sulfotransferase family protein [Maricaulis parjimensis]